MGELELDFEFRIFNNFNRMISGQQNVSSITVIPAKKNGKKVTDVSNSIHSLQTVEFWNLKLLRPQ